jgi:hypothetical protein
MMIIVVAVRHTSEAKQTRTFKVRPIAPESKTKQAMTTTKKIKRTRLQHKPRSLHKIRTKKPSVLAEEAYMVTKTSQRWTSMPRLVSLRINVDVHLPSLLALLLEVLAFHYYNRPRMHSKFPSPSAQICLCLRFRLPSL